MKQGFPSPSPGLIDAFVRERYGDKFLRVHWEEDTYRGLNQYLIAYTRKNPDQWHRYQVPQDLIMMRDARVIIEWVANRLDSLVYERPKRLGGNTPFLPGRKRVRLPVKRFARRHKFNWGIAR